MVSVGSHGFGKFGKDLHVVRIGNGFGCGCAKTSVWNSANFSLTWKSNIGENVGKMRILKKILFLPRVVSSFCNLVLPYNTCPYFHLVIPSLSTDLLPHSCAFLLLSYTKQIPDTTERVCHKRPLSTSCGCTILQEASRWHQGLPHGKLI